VVPDSAGARRKRGRADEADEGIVLACGTAAGRVVASDLTNPSAPTIAIVSVVASTVWLGLTSVLGSQTTLPSAVTSVCLDRSASAVWVACEGSKYIHSFPVKASAKEAAQVKVPSKGMGPVTALATVPLEGGDALLIGGGELAIAPSASSRANVSLAGGHSASIACIGVSSDGALVASVDVERTLCLWTGTAISAAVAQARTLRDKKARANVSLARTVTLEDVPTTVRVARVAEDSFVIVSACATGVSLVLATVGSSVSVSKVFYPSAAVAGRTEVLDAHVANGRTVVAIGAPIAPTLTFSGTMTAAGSLQPKWAASEQPAPGPASLSSSSSVAASHPAGTGIPMQEAKRSKLAVEEEEEAVSEDEDIGVSLAERLSALAGAVKTAPLPSATAHAPSSSSASSKDALVAMDPRPASMATVLAQALHSDDAAQLEIVLSSTAPEAIEATVAKLEPRYIVPFLRQVVSRFESKPARGPTMARWLRAVLIHHAAALASTPGLVQQLAGVYHVIDARLASYRKMLRLAGRLDLLMGQLGSRSGGNALSGEVDASHAIELTLSMEE
jgi:hypothetical protein